MEKSLNYLSLVLVILLLGVYITREITKNEFTKKLDEVEAIRDSLVYKMEEIDKDLLLRDELIQKQIEASKEVILELNSRRTLTQKEIDEYDKKIEDLKNQLQKDEQ